MRRIWHMENGKLVPGPAERRPRAGALIIKDIEPYRAIDGTLIGSRAQHRAYLASKGAVELGNEFDAFVAAQKPRDPSIKEIDADLRDAIEQCRAGKGTEGYKLDPEIKEHLDLTQVQEV